MHAKAQTGGRGEKKRPGAERERDLCKLSPLSVPCPPCLLYFTKEVSGEAADGRRGKKKEREPFERGRTRETEEKRGEESTGLGGRREVKEEFCVQVVEWKGEERRKKNMKRERALDTTASWAAVELSLPFFVNASSPTDSLTAEWTAAFYLLSIGCLAVGRKGRQTNPPPLYDAPSDCLFLPCHLRD
mmetsp:Transcript_17534/g.35594  ORF Transcript_17534/g.35594 Transcript_17534/m.35594 type:complete len:188 (-) Transcript_17534:2553-3116(-)